MWIKEEERRQNGRKSFLCVGWRRKGAVPESVEMFVDSFY